MNEILLRAMKDGRLEAIFRRWNMWNDDQPRLYATAGWRNDTAVERTAILQPLTGWDAAVRYLPALGARR